MSLKTLSPHVKTASLYEFFADIGVTAQDFSHVQRVALYDL